jgi:DNA-binding transcriptional LysR family regulator
VAIVTDPVPDPLVRRHILLRDPLLLVLPSSRRFARGKKGVAQLAAEPFLLFPRAQTPSLWDHIMKACSDYGFVPQVQQEAQSWHAIFGMVAAGMGITIAPASALEHRLPGITSRPLRAPATNICVCVAAHDTRDLVQSFVQAARDHIKRPPSNNWQYEDDDKRTKTVTVLEIPPVDSAQTAVKVAIAAKAKQV